MENGHNGRLCMLTFSYKRSIGTYEYKTVLNKFKFKFLGIKYFMATCGGQNCDSVCTTFGLKCASTGQSFPRFSALEIFESLGITCKTNNYTDIYQYEDQPNYMADSPNGSEYWIGMCIGFKSIPSTIDCHTANNSYVRRLCPCYDPLGEYLI